jgi:hypothetical protein
MATTTGKVLRQRLSERISDYTPLTTTSAGNGAKTSWVDTGLKNLQGGEDPDFCEGWYILITDSDAASDGETRRISSYNSEGDDGDSPTGQVGQAFTGGQIETGTDYELHRWDPALKKESINRAIRLLYSTLYLPVTDGSIVVDDILTNGNVEDWNSTNDTPDSWTKINSPTVSRESSIVFRGSFSAKVISPSGSVGQLTQTPDVNLADVTGQTATLRARVRTDAATQARLILDFSSSTKNGDYHTGDVEFQRLSASSTIPTDATQVKAVLEVIAGTKTAYFDHVYLVINPKYRYILPTSLVSWPNHITMQYNEADVNGLYYPFPPGARPIPGRILRIEGMGILTQPSTDSATVEIGEPHTDLVIAYAEMLFWRQMASPARSAQSQRQGYLDAAQDAANEVELLARRLRMPRLGATTLEEVAHYEQDSTNKYLVFDRTRQSVASGQVAV